ncbi:MAG: ankyrin repeat domain-containing protein [Proteobacteria bacterium]|nr:ankyrin repeat domain-containing protein [Pseudomonadota bacterium]MBU1741665.1 ankyrin repeat domain-containing protein [Pseudomonadota bacterium]
MRPLIVIGVVLLSLGWSALASSRPGLDHRKVVGPSKDHQVKPSSDLEPATRPTPPIIRAVRRADLESLRKILDKRPGAVNTRDDSVGGLRWSALHWLVWLAGSGPPSPAVKLLLGKGARVNVRDELGLTPLHLAAWRGRTELAAMLLQRGAAVNARSKSGRLTPLHCAASAGHAKLVVLLIKKGGNPNGPDACGWTPLHGAAFEGRGRVVTMLLVHGAAVNVKDKGGRTPLFWARAGRHSAVARLLVNKGGR